MTTRIADGFAEAAWVEHAPTSPLHDPSWLRAMVSRLPGEAVTVTSANDVAFVGAVVREPDAYEAYNPDAILWRADPVFEIADPSARAAALERLKPGRVSTLPALVLVAPGYYGDPAGDGADDVEAVTACLKDVVAWCEQTALAGLHVLFSASGAVAAAVAELGGCMYPITTRSVLPVRWDDWNGYLATLPAKRRREVERELRHVTPHLTLDRVDPARYADDLVEGRCALLVRYGQHADRDAEAARLDRLVAAFGSRVTAYGGLRNGRLIASCLCLERGRSLQVMYSSVTEEGHTLPFAHFATTYYAVIQHVSRPTHDEIDYGISHRRGKEARGCVTTRLYGHAVGVAPGAAESLAAAADLLTRYAEEAAP